MNIFEKIKQALRKEGQAYTQQQLADRAGLTQAHIGRLLSGKSPVEKLQLGSFKKLFPEAEINLAGGIPDELEYERDAIVKWYFRPENRQERYALLQKIEHDKKNTTGLGTKSKAG